ncbi:MAG: transposase [Planctomycetaceae bacterium]|nr:transposase [Planctomycetaceae bacterium]
MKNKESRKKFLEDKRHRIRFIYTPKHCSWLNQIENWFSGLTCRILKRGNFVIYQWNIFLYLFTKLEVLHFAVDLLVDLL